LSLVFISGVFTWHETGHMMVAQIAKTILAKEDPAALAAATDLLQEFSKYAGEVDQPFVEAATWPDKIKEDHNKQMEGWHWVSNIVSNDTTPISTDVKINTHDDHNVTVQILDDIASLKYPTNGGKDTPWYGNQDRRYMKSFSLRNLIHFVGDVHQPLHGTEGISKTHPNGDRGGNEVSIWMDNFNGSNLHFYWDHAFYYFSPTGKDEGELSSPLNATNKDFPVKYAKDLMESYPREKYPAELYTKIDPVAWGLESAKIAKESVYPGAIEHKAFSAEYIKMAQEICKERIALGGYRLAEVIKVALAGGAGSQVTTQMSKLSE
jgi:hypothetical protein